MRRAQPSAITCTAALFYIFFSFKTASAILSTEWQRFSEGEQLVYIMGVADQLTMIAGHIRDNGGARTATEQAVVDRSNCALNRRLTYRQLHGILQDYLNTYPDKAGFGTPSNFLAALGKYCGQY